MTSHPIIIHKGKYITFTNKEVSNEARATTDVSRPGTAGKTNPKILIFPGSRKGSEAAIQATEIQIQFIVDLIKKGETVQVPIAIGQTELVEDIIRRLK